MPVKCTEIRSETPTAIDITPAWYGKPRRYYADMAAISQAMSNHEGRPELCGWITGILFDINNVTATCFVPVEWGDAGLERERVALVAMLDGLAKTDESIAAIMLTKFHREMTQAEVSPS